MIIFLIYLFLPSVRICSPGHSESAQAYTYIPTSLSIFIYFVLYTSLPLSRFYPGLVYWVRTQIRMTIVLQLCTLVCAHFDMDNDLVLTFVRTAEVHITLLNTPPHLRLGVYFIHPNARRRHNAPWCAS